MTGSKVSGRPDSRLHSVVERIASAMSEVFSGAVSRPMVVTPHGEACRIDIEGWLWLLEGEKAVLRGSLTGEFEGRDFLIVLQVEDAAVLAGGGVGGSDAAITKVRDSARVHGHHLEGLGSLGDIVCNRLDTLLRDVLRGDVGLQFRDHATIRTGFDQGGVLGQGDRLILGHGIRIGDLPESEAFLILDPETARAWNDGEDIGSNASGRLRRDGDDTILDSSARGSVSAFLVSEDAGSMIRECGDRVGLLVRQRRQTDVPDAADIRGEIVVIEIPVGDDRRFEWAARLKKTDRSIPVLLLIHMPSRARVIQAAMTGADAVAAWPSLERDLSARLESMIPDAAAG